MILPQAELAVLLPGEELGHSAETLPAFASSSYSLSSRKASSFARPNRPSSSGICRAVWFAGVVQVHDALELFDLVLNQIIPRDADVGLRIFSLGAIFRVSDARSPNLTNSALAARRRSPCRSLFSFSRSSSRRKPLTMSSRRAWGSPDAELRGLSTVDPVAD